MSIGRGIASPYCPGGWTDGESFPVAPQRQVRACAHGGGVSEGDVPPSEVGRFWNFYTEFVQFGEYFEAKFMSLLMFIFLLNSVYSPSFPLLSLFSFPFSSLLFFFPFLSLFSFFFLPSLFPCLSFLLFLSFPPSFPSRLFSPLPDFWCPGEGADR